MSIEWRQFSLGKTMLLKRCQSADDVGVHFKDSLNADFFPHMWVKQHTRYEDYEEFQDWQSATEL